MDTSTSLEASPPSSPSSSSSTTSSSSPYNVFLSFGEDTRKTFTDHLYWTMKDAGIDFFMEENESIRRGENISDKVKQIIEESKVSVIVFSSMYADSIWCLEELVQIMECRRTLKQMVLPIFYDLSPSDVLGSFLLAFQKHIERFHEDTDIQEKLRRWTDALTVSAGLAVWTDALTAVAGLTVWTDALTAAAGLPARVFRTTNGYEGMFIRVIIDEIAKLLQSPTPIEIAFTDSVKSPLSTPPGRLDSPELALSLMSSAKSPLSTLSGKLDSPELALSLMSSAKSPISTPPGKLDSPKLALSPMSSTKSPLSTTPRSRSSQYRGVTFYRRTGRWESHIWDYGKQVYLGAFDTAHAAARAYDRAAIKFRGIEADINFSVSDYEDDIKQMSNLTKEEFVHIIRRQSIRPLRGMKNTSNSNCEAKISIEERERESGNESNIDHESGIDQQRVIDRNSERLRQGTKKHLLSILYPG
ncbi:uncharacterized protein LOC125479545 isoform X1 [Pyrus x bretschneideri]|uniref:uncharacterized protein LOC125479545 isoform X1 n=1 Tax=Pyrus x bretschneideri TaxID=225117 RepID=UPI00203060A0|nr:uncharacterized protein LOC125479545 isoform X1 [Pyrus x bretschneideri]XP_048444950.1 uncharacterized protein LOC125479545 isoform X1 [Pyrus x bretschneideri]